MSRGSVPPALSRVFERLPIPFPLREHLFVTVAAAAVIAPAAPAPAQTTVSAAATQDSWLEEALADTNHGTATALEVFQLGGNNNDDRAVMQFDLSSIPVGTTVQSAALDVFVTSTEENAQVDIHRVTDTWAESTVTWNNTAADFAGTASASFTAQAGSVSVGTSLRWFKAGCRGPRRTRD